MSEPKRQRWALISVSNKNGVVNFGEGLVRLGFKIASTGGTLRELQEGGVPAVSISQLTGMGELLGGRLKTLHPTSFGGILADRASVEDMKTLDQHAFPLIDVVAVNLYPFAQTAAKPGVQDHEVIEQIDIGGPSLLRAAAKNHASVYSI